MSDDLGKRIKENYENRTRYFLPKRTYTILRLDGKAFHTFTKNFKRPYDLDFMNLMNMTALELCKQIQGAKFAFVQSDEISILVTDFDKINSDSWFDGNLQKIVSVSSSIATMAFNKEFLKLQMKSVSHENVEHLLDTVQLALFDSRAFTITDPTEVANSFIWRQLDASKNSILMLAMSKLSHKEMQNKNTAKLQEILFTNFGINWNDEPVGFKRGRMIVKNPEEKSLKSKWIIIDPPVFTQDQDFLNNLIPKFK